MSPPNDPYAAPANSLASTEMSAERGPRPVSVVVATVAAALTLLLTSARSIQQLTSSGDGVVELLLQVAIGGLILVGLWRGNRLAWQWGRVVGVLTIVLYLFGVVSIASNDRVSETVKTVALAVAGAILLIITTMVVSLSTAPSFRFYRLICPRCGKRTTAAADFFFKKAKCKSCQTTF